MAFSKTWQDMFEVDVSSFVKDRDGYKYLSWAVCKKLLHDYGAEKVYFEPLFNDKGSSLFMTDIPFVDKNNVANRCYEVRVKIVIDDKEFIYSMPVMNGPNPVKDNSMSQLRINNAHTRAFVKGVAVHTGLGFSLWLDDDYEFDDTYELSKHNILSIKERVEQIISNLIAKKMTLKEIATAINTDEERLVADLKYYQILDRIEKSLLKIAS